MECATVEYLLMSCLPPFDLGAYDYYIYNNRYFVPIEVDLDDMLEPTEGFLHICTRDVDPAVDRIRRPESVILVSELFNALHIEPPPAQI
jgi:hypothetical protein